MACTMSETRAYWRRHVTQWRASGESARRYGEAHGVTEKSLWSWASRFKKEEAGAETAMRWAKIEPRGQRSRIVMRVGEVRISVTDGFDAETLDAILAVLDRRSS